MSRTINNYRSNLFTSGGTNMKNDICIKCGSKDIAIKEKEFEFSLPNPGKISVSQECKECQSCGEVYFNSKEIDELSVKIKNATKNELL